MNTMLKTPRQPARKLLTLLLAGSTLVGGLALAQPGQDKKKNRDDIRPAQQGEKGQGQGQQNAQRGHFSDEHRTMTHDYYVGQYSAGRCPPGLAKKNNGCRPPGLAKRWDYGHPLPRDLIFYEVPRDLVLRIGQPPSGHRYVRVASDILMIAIGTGMVIDAIQDLGW